MKVAKMLTVVMLCAMLVACQRSVTNEAIAFAQEQCSANSGVSYIINEGHYRDRSTEYYVICKNTVKITFRIKDQ